MVASRRFQLHRDVDVSGVSGPGVVADGTVFDAPHTFSFPEGGRLVLPAGWALLTWRGEHASTVLWESLDDAMAIHGHNGCTRLVYLDEH